MPWLRVKMKEGGAHVEMEARAEVKVENRRWWCSLLSPPPLRSIAIVLHHVGIHFNEFAFLEEE